MVMFSVFQHTLLKGLQHVKKGMQRNKKPVLPIAGNTLLIAERNQLTLVTTDLQTMAHISVGALVQYDGRCTLPIHVLTDCIKTIPAKDKRGWEIQLDFVWNEDTSQMTIKSEASRQMIVLNGITADNWPLSMIPVLDMPQV